MPTMSDVQSVAANTSTGNILAGKEAEFIVGPSVVRFYIVGAAAGLFATILVGGQSIMADQEISGANRYPVRDEDLSAAIGALPGERLDVRLRNSTGGALVVQTLVDVLPA